MALSYFISQVRRDFHLMVNEVLCREATLGKYFLPIDFRETKEAQKINIQTRATAIDYLSQGQVIGIFPSGGVATIEHIWNTKAVDLPWKRFVVQLIRRSGASVLPIYFEGQNSRLFQWASHIRQDARLGLLLFELNNKRNKPINMTVGNLLPYDSLPKDAGDLLAFLYNRTFELATI
jgi:putative hemolysin